MEFMELQCADVNIRLDVLAECCMGDQCLEIGQQRHVMFDEQMHVVVHAQSGMSPNETMTQDTRGNLCTMLHPSNTRVEGS